MLYVVGILIIFHVLVCGSRDRIQAFVKRSTDPNKSHDERIEYANVIYRKLLLTVVVTMSCLVLEVWYLTYNLLDDCGSYIDAFYLSVCLMWLIRMVWDREFIKYVRCWSFHVIAIVYYMYYVYRITI